MASATYAIQHFLGGEVSQFAQGRFDKPDYRNSLNVCFNAFPVEIGTWARRPGTQFAGTTRGGSIGRIIEFDFQQSNAVTLEFTDGYLRFRSGVQLLDANDSQVVVAVSTANPAVVETTSATNWVTGETLMFPGASTPLLENRQFIATQIDTTHFSLVDAITGATLDGSTLGALVADAEVTRVQELATRYIAGAWASIRAVQAETTDILLNGNVAPQALTVTTLPAAGVNPIFAIGSAVFNDGPYLDPFTNGVQATPNQSTGIIQITLAFPAYVATTAYPIGSFVTSASINYVSLVDQNVGNTPATSPTAWQATAAGAAINNGAGFLSTDIGRLVRLFAEPVPWSAATAYTAGNTVSYNPSGVPGASTYWQCIANSTAFVPGTDTTHWQLLTSNAAQWTWGKITSLLNFIPGNIAGVAQIGAMTGHGGLAASFDGITSKVSIASSFSSSPLLTLNSPGASAAFDAFVGQNYSGTGATAYALSSASVFPPSDFGLVTFTISSQIQLGGTPTVILGGNVLLYGSNSAPSGPKDGTLLGVDTIPQQTLVGPATGVAYTTGYSPVTVLATDQVTTWKYVWMVIEPSAVLTTNLTTMDFVFGANSAQVQVVAAGTSSATNSGVNVELLGPPLLYTNPIHTWRLGAYSDTTGWPTCGTYHEGRLWLGGAIDNRFDACVSNGIVGSAIDFAPTNQYGVVAASNAISYTLNSDGVNPIFWFQPDLQGIIIGTQAGEWLVQAPTNGPIAPANIAARRVTKIGCANVEPRRTEHTTVLVQRYGQKLMEYFADVYSGKFSAPNLADKAQHITRAGIAELAYQCAAAPIIWGRDRLGALFGITYKRDTLTTSQGPTFYGWHRHTLGSGRLVESICGGPSVGGGLDTLTMITTDPTTNIRHVELLTDTMDEAAALTAAWFLDDAVAPTSTVSTNVASDGAPYGGLTLNGLWHLNDKTVTVFAAGLDCGDFLIVDGSCFVPYGDSVSGGTGGGLFTAEYVASITPFPIVVGFTYNSDGQMVRPISIADTGARLGPALGDLRRNHRYSMLLNNTLGLSVGGSSFANMLPALLQQQNGAAIAALTTFSGIHQDSLKDDFSYDGMISWRVSRPFPANVVAISGNISTKDQ